MNNAELKILRPTATMPFLQNRLTPLHRCRSALELCALCALPRNGCVWHSRPVWSNVRLVCLYVMAVMLWASSMVASYFLPVSLEDNSQLPSSSCMSLCPRSTPRVIVHGGMHQLVTGSHDELAKHKARGKRSRTPSGCWTLVRVVFVALNNEYHRIRCIIVSMSISIVLA